MAIVRGLIRRILADPARRRELAVRLIMSCQELEGRDADRAAAERAYDAVIAERGEPEPHFPEPRFQLPDIDLDEPHDHANDERRNSQGK